MRPQHINLVEKFFCLLTISQFCYFVFGGVVVYILFVRLEGTGFSFLFWILAIPIGTFSFAMAFIKIQDRPFPSFFFAMIKFITTPRARAWRHYSKPTAPKPKKVVKKPSDNPKKSFDTVRVSELSEILDQDIPRKTE